MSEILPLRLRSGLKAPYAQDDPSEISLRYLTGQAEKMVGQSGRPVLSDIFHLKTSGPAYRFAVAVTRKQSGLCPCAASLLDDV